MLINISVPEDSECLLKSGQKVDFDTNFLEKKFPADKIIPVSEKLQVKPGRIFRYLKKFVGDQVAKNEVIAVKKGMFSTQTIISDSNGLIKEINHIEGYLLISSLEEKIQIKSYFKGEVVDISKNIIKIKLGSGEEFGLKTANSNFGGETLYIKDKNKVILDQDSLHKIMIIDSFTNYIKAKAEALGIKGFVSLTKPEDVTSTTNAQIKNIEDFKKIINLNFPYCLIDKNYSKIYFYR